jgi:hypothetical protein
VDNITIRRLLAYAGCGGILALASLSPTPQANANPSCGIGVQSTTSWFGGSCDSPPVFPTGQHFHCSWGAGFELCEYRWYDNSPAPYPRPVPANFGPVLS